MVLDSSLLLSILLVAAVFSAMVVVGLVFVANKLPQLGFCMFLILAFLVETAIAAIFQPTIDDLLDFLSFFIIAVLLAGVITSILNIYRQQLYERLPNFLRFQRLDNER